MGDGHDDVLRELGCEGQRRGQSAGDQMSRGKRGPLSSRRIALAQPILQISQLTIPRHAFALSVNATTAPSLIPFAHDSVLPYLSLPPQLLQERAIPLQEDRGVFGMTFYPDREDPTKRIEYGNEDDVVGYMSPRWCVYRQTQCQS